MADKRTVHVHLLPELVPAGGLRGATTVVIDVLLATTTMITALAAGCTDVGQELHEARHPDRPDPGREINDRLRSGSPKSSWAP
jgi:hypothetical protein